MSFETMKGNTSDFLAFSLSKLILKRVSLKTPMTALRSDTEAALSRFLKEKAGEVSSISGRLRCSVGRVTREATSAVR